MPRNRLLLTQSLTNRLVSAPRRNWILGSRFFLITLFDAGFLGFKPFQWTNSIIYEQT